MAIAKTPAVLARKRLSLRSALLKVQPESLPGVR
jgi:hypothetical protein